MATDINDFLAAFTGDRKFFLHLPVLWTVNMDGVSVGAINSVLTSAGEKWSAKVSPDAMTKNGNILVAQSVSLPNESSSFTPMEIGGNTGGFLPGFGLNQRSNFLDRGFSINFLETEMDIEHNFFRPWMIAMGIKGLIEEGQSIKGTIRVEQYTNSGNRMKGFQFNKVFPTAVESYTLDYENTDFKVKSVTFACQNYEQL